MIINLYIFLVGTGFGVALWCWGDSTDHEWGKMFRYVAFYFAEINRLWRKEKRLRARLDRISDLAIRKTYCDEKRKKIAELEQKLVGKAFSQPEEFLDTK